MRIDGFKVIRVAKTNAKGEPILKDGEGCIQRNGIFYVVDNQISLEELE